MTLLDMLRDEKQSKLTQLYTGLSVQYCQIIVTHIGLIKVKLRLQTHSLLQPTIIDIISHT